MAALYEAAWPPVAVAHSHRAGPARTGKSWIQLVEPTVQSGRGSELP
jgi:hypothetical protein